MQLTENTVFITGGSSGIGAALAGALQALGNKVIVSGRKRNRLDEFVRENPEIEAIELDVGSATSVSNAARFLSDQHPDLNVLINNAGIMIGDDASVRLDEDAAISQISTNMLGPMRVTSSLIALLRRQERAHIVYNSSALAFTPLASFAVYSATKAALHSYALSQRFLLKDTRVTVQELVAPWVGTGLLGPPDHPLAMPMDQFIEGTMVALGTDAPEVFVEEARPFRENPGLHEHAFVDHINNFFLAQSF
ncbi:putative oxidoreductase [Luteibacter sp. HA06]